jgi:outer membrane protein assembly factor BamB
MYRDGDDDVVVALRATDGATVWEHRYPGATYEGNLLQFGKGPNATPLLLDDRLVTLGYGGMLHCLNRATGDVLWSHDLIADFGGDVLEFGYSASPIFHDGKILVLVGGDDQGVVALRPDDGGPVWKSEPRGVTYVTPMVIDVDGQEQIVYFSPDAVHGIEPQGGGHLWSFPVVNQYENHATPAHWTGEFLWVATQLDGGTRALRLTRTDTGTHVEEAWSSNRMSIHHWNSVLVDDHVYAAVGGQASFFISVDIRTGEEAWRIRGYPQANSIHSDDKLILLDKAGHLSLAGVSPEGLELLADAQISDGATWTVPTLVGTTLFVRDRTAIMALDLGRARS